MKTKFYLFFLFLPFFCFGQSAPEVELIIENASCKEASTSLKFDLIIKNNTQDTIVFVRPVPQQFSNHQRANGSATVGELEKPYQIKLIQTGTCLEPKSWDITNAEPRLVWYSKYNNIKILPGQSSKAFSLSLGMNFNFCKEVDYRLQITYEPKYKQLTAEEKTKLLDYHRKYESLAVEAKKYLSEEGLLNGKWDHSKSIMQYIVNRASFAMEKISPLKIETKSVEVVKK